MYAMTPIWKPCLPTTMTDKVLFGLPVFWIPLSIHLGYMIGCVQGSKHSSNKLNSQLPNNIVLKFWWLLFQIFLEKKFDLICFKLFFTLIFFWLALMITICFKIWSFTMNLFHLLGFTKELVFGSSTSVTRLNLSFCVFLDRSHFFKEPSGIACYAFETFSRGCILSEKEMISFLPIKTFP